MYLEIKAFCCLLAVGLLPFLLFVLNESEMSSFPACMRMISGTVILLEILWNVTYPPSLFAQLCSPSRSSLGPALSAGGSRAGICQGSPPYCTDLHGQSNGRIPLSSSPGSTEHGREGVMKRRAWFHLLQYQPAGMNWVCGGAA